VLLSDGDINAELDAGRVALEPFDPAMIQPSSIDVRLDRFFRVFENHRYPHIDPAEDQPELTREVEPEGEEPFILHPGEFVLGSTYEVVTLPDDVAARLEGKALSLDTPVPTPRGWASIGSLAPGDEVFGADGLPTRVVATTAVQVDRPCYEVLFSDGQRFIADAEHLWVTSTKLDRYRAGARAPGSARRTADLATSLRHGTEVNHHVPLAGPVQTPDVELPVAPYTFGVWLGDGTSTKAEVTVGVGDEQTLDEIRADGYEVWKATGVCAYRIGGTHRTRNARSGRFEADSSLNSVLRLMGQFGNKHVPGEYLFAGTGQRLALLQGLMDSDGYVDVYGRCEFVSTRETLADAVLHLAASLGLRPVKRKKRAMLDGVDCGPAYQVKFTPRLPVFRLARKVARLKQDDRGHQSRGIIEVREVPSVPVRCIQVAAPDGQFLVGPTFIPTHNSSLGRLGLLTHSTAGFIDPGFSGHVTLELANVANLPIKLWPGMKIGQLCFFRLSSPAEHPYGSEKYGSRYQGQRGPTPSRSFQSFHRTEVR
jgi:deoxycytidine triphosphate deaminase